MTNQEPDLSTFQNRLHWFRSCAGLTHDQLAKETKISARILVAAEVEELRYPLAPFSEQEIERIAKAIGVSYWYLLLGGER